MASHCTLADLEPKTLMEFGTPGFVWNARLVVRASYPTHFLRGKKYFEPILSCQICSFLRHIDIIGIICVIINIVIIIIIITMMHHSSRSSLKGRALLPGAHSEDHEGVVCYVGLSVYVQWNSNVDAWFRRIRIWGSPLGPKTLQGTNISHLGKFGKSSTQKYLFLKGEIWIRFQDRPQRPVGCLVGGFFNCNPQQVLPKFCARKETSQWGFTISFTEVLAVGLTPLVFGCTCCTSCALHTYCATFGAGVIFRFFVARPC